MKILIVNPPAWKGKDYIREGRCMQTRSSWAALWMPLSLCYISGVLREKGHSVRLVVCIADKRDLCWLSDVAAKFRPELAVINTAIPSVTGDMQAASVLKQVLPGLKIAIIGMFPSLYE